MTTTFYVPPGHISGNQVVLPDDEARHAVRVLRHQPGDEIVAVDGLGGRHRVRLDVADKKAALGTIVHTEHGVGEPAYELTMAVGLLKNASRFETFVEKAVELGVTEIVPVTSARTEKGRMKESRLHNVLVAAMKQSGRSRLPRLAPVTPFSDMLMASSDGLRLCCHESATAPVLDALSTPFARVSVLIGPEGGFSNDEVEQAQAAGWSLASLGPRRLRAETAAIAACTAVQLAADRH